MRRLSISVLMSLAIAASAQTAFSQEFALQVGPPVAGGAQQAKKSVFVVRPGGCADPAAAQITATAEGLVNGVRQSVPLKLAALPTPGVHAVSQDWPNGGFWIVNLAGTCAGKSAGAIVPLGATNSYRRETVKLLAHPPTPAEIDASLKALTGGQE